MTFRPWFVALALVGVLALNGVLVAKERLPTPQQGPDVIRVDEVLRHLQYLPATRRNNFKEMGMNDDLADATARYIDRYTRKRAQFDALLTEQAAEVGSVFCPGTGLPQPYAAMVLLVQEENDRRDAIDAERLKLFEEQEWFSTVPVDAVYTHLELTEGRRSDATLMGVSALLMSKEDDALDGHSPWSTGLMGSWGWAPLKKEFPAAEMKVIQYFSLMHYLTELANTRDGICS